MKLKSAWLFPCSLSVVRFSKTSVPFERKPMKVMIQFNAALAVAPWYYLNEASPRNIGQQGTLQSEAKFRSREKYLSGGVAQKVSDDK